MGIHTVLYLLFSSAGIVILIIELMYSIRIFRGMIEVYGEKVKNRFLWILMWIFFEGLTALIWGYSKKYQPAWQVEDTEDRLY